MKRREFGRKIVSSAMGAGLSGSFVDRTASALVAGATQRNISMHVGGDYHSVAGSGITSRENLQYNLRHGVKHLTVTLSKTSPEGAWDRDEIKRMKDNCDHYGVHLEAIRILYHPAERSGTGSDAGRHSRKHSESVGGRRQNHHVPLDGHSHPAQQSRLGTRRLHLRGLQARRQL